MGIRRLKPLFYTELEIPELYDVTMKFITKLITLFFRLFLFALNPLNWIHWRRSMEKIRHEFYWIWLKANCYYLHECCYPRILRRIREKSRLGRVIHVGFMVYDKSKWSVDSVYRHFAADPAFHPVIYIFPDEQAQGGPANGVRESRQFFENLGCNTEYGYDPETGQYASLRLFRNVDILFFDTPWFRTHSVLQIEKIGRHSLTCYVPYGFMAAGGMDQSHYNMPNHSFAWRVFPENQWHKSQFAIHNYATGDRNVEVFGYPKLDVYALPVERPDSIWKSGMDSQIRRVIWAPHWTIYTDGAEVSGQWSTFHLLYKEMLEFAKGHPEIDWLFKPHPVLQAAIVKSGLMTQKEAEEYYAEWDSYPNTQTCFSGNFWDYFKTSDALLTDSVSFLVEYLPTEKPIFHIESPSVSNEQYNELVSMMVATYYSGRTMTDIDMFIQQVIIGDNDYKKEERLTMIDYLPNIGTSGHLISQYLENYCKGVVDDERKD